MGDHVGIPGVVLFHMINDTWCCAFPFYLQLLLLHSLLPAGDGYGNMTLPLSTDDKSDDDNVTVNRFLEPPVEDAASIDTTNPLMATYFDLKTNDATDETDDDNNNNNMKVAACASVGGDNDPADSKIEDYLVNSIQSETMAAEEGEEKVQQINGQNSIITEAHPVGAASCMDKCSKDEEHVASGNSPTNESFASSTSTSSSVLEEAERQAAIAAAISANSNTMSPSAAAGIAKMTAMVGRSSGMKKNPLPPPPPMPLSSSSPKSITSSNASSNRRSIQFGSPTMATLPPPPLPPPISLSKAISGKSSSSTSPPSCSAPFRPVKFQDVKIAFHDILRASSTALAKASKPLKVDIDTDPTNVNAKNAVELSLEEENKVVNNLHVGGVILGANGGPVVSSAVQQVLGDKTMEDEKNVDAVESESLSTAMANTAEKDVTITMEDTSLTRGGTSTTPSTLESKMEKISSSTTTTTPKTITSSSSALYATIPDSFLRFLLLVARIPVVLEGHVENSPIEAKATASQSEEKGQDDDLPPPPPEARAASQRAYEILCMARSLYDTICERENRRSLYDGEKLDDTTSFFAACEQGGVKNDGKRSTIKNNAVYTGNESVSEAVAPIAELGINGRFDSMSKGGLMDESTQPSSSSSPPAISATSMASSVFSNVLSKMAIPTKQGSFTDIGKKLMGSTAGGPSPGVGQHKSEHSTASRVPQDEKTRQMGDYEILINNEMLGLTVENVLERTIIRTLLPNGAAVHAGAQVGSLIAKVGNVDTTNLTHFETIDELRRSQRPLKLTLRHVRGSLLRKAREEMGRLIRGHGVETTPDGSGCGGSNELNHVRPWRGSSSSPKQRTSFIGETFDCVLNNRWPLNANNKSLPSAVSAGNSSVALTRSESLHQAGRKLIRVLVLLIVGSEKELSSLINVLDSEYAGAKRTSLSPKEHIEALEISSKVLLEYACSLPDITEERSRAAHGSSGSSFVPHGSSFYPVPPGRVQGRKSGPPPSPGKGQTTQKGKKHPGGSPLLRIGDALQRTRSFLVDLSSVTATTLRWEIIDYLCMVLDLDTEQELSEQESASSTSGKGDVGSSMNDLGAAGSILKLIVVNCSTIACDTTFHHDNIIAQPQYDHTDLDLSFLDESSLDESVRSIASSTSTAGNCFLSVVHRLAASKSVSGRVSACSLSPVLWSHLDFPRQLQLRGVITRALHDVEIIVRKSTAVVLHDIAELVFDRRAVPWLVLMCERSMTDPEPQLRAAAMTLTWHLAEHLPNAFLGDATKGSRSIRRLPPRDSQTFMDVYLLQCKLFPVANNLAEDRVASVRLSVAAQCDRLCTALGEHWFSVIIDLLQSLLSDSDDMVRSEAILCMPRLVESVIVGTSNIQGSIKVLESLLPLALKIQKDSSSLVRSSLATATGELLIFLVGLGGGGGSSISSLHESPPSPGQPPPSPGGSGTIYGEHKKHVDDTLIPILQKLLQDSDPEVTTASLRAVTNASRSGTARERSNSRMPSASNIDDDLVSLSSHQSHHSHTSYERTKPVFIPVLSEKQVLRLLPTLSNLGTSNQWRVRQSAVEIVPALMGCTHRHETRHEISKLCVKLMNDKVDAVRKTAAECLCLGGSSFARHGQEDGGEWIKTIVIPQLKECSNSEDSKQRLLGLKMIEIIIINGLCLETSSASVIETESYCPSSPAREDDESIGSSFADCERPVRLILNIAASHTSDKVANVRLNVGRTFGSILPLLDRSDVDFVVEKLQKQLEEETSRSGGGDRDVIYFAQQAISMSQPFRRMLSRTSTCSNDDIDG